MNPLFDVHGQSGDIIRNFASHIVLKKLMRMTDNVIECLLRDRIFNKRLYFVVHTIHHPPHEIVHFEIGNKADGWPKDGRCVSCRLQSSWCS